MILVESLGDVLAGSSTVSITLIQGLVLDLSELGVLIPELAVESGDLFAELSDLINQLHVLFHDVVVILLVDLSFLLKALLE